MVDDWWKEAKAADRKPSTYESYRNTVVKLVAALKRFKDARIESGVSPKTVKDSDLAGLKTAFGWAVNRYEHEEFLRGQRMMVFPCALVAALTFLFLYLN